MFKIPTRESREDGFTLVELLVVILIIGILSGIAIPAFLNQRKSAAEASLKSDLANAAKQYENLYIKSKTYPASPDAAGVKISPGVVLEAGGSSGSTSTETSTTTTTSPGSTPGSIIVPMKAVGASSTANVEFWVYEGYLGYMELTYKPYAPQAQNITTALTAHCDDGTSISTTETVTVGPSYSSTAEATLWFERCANTSYNVTHFEVKKTTSSEFETFNVASPGFTAPEPAPSTTTTTTSTAPAGTFCIQGYHDSDPTNYWHYSSPNGGLKAGKCT